MSKKPSGLITKAGLQILQEQAEKHSDPEHVKRIREYLATLDPKLYE